MRSWPGSEVAGGSSRARRRSLLAGCSTGDDAVAQGGTFEFVAPGGKTDIFYDPPESRGRPGTIGRARADGPAPRRVSLDDFAGKVVVINVWGQWCGPCRTRSPSCRRCTTPRAPTVSPSSASTSATTTATPHVDFVTDRKVTFPSIYDPPMRTMIAFGGRYPTTVIPSTIVLDRQHRVAAVFLRELLAEDLQPVVQTAGGREADDAADVSLDRVDRTDAGGPVLLALCVSVLAGLVSFASPCVVPLVPGYLSYLAAVVGVEDAGRRPRWRSQHGAAARARARRRCSSRASPRCSCSAPSRCSGMTTHADHQSASAATHRRRGHDRDGPGVRRLRPRAAARGPVHAAAAVHARAARRCSVRSSRSAGRRASARR